MPDRALLGNGLTTHESLLLGWPAGQTSVALDARAAQKQSFTQWDGLRLRRRSQGQLRLSMYS
eukprot:9401188-Pyramimonas_sp.AAC.1